MQVQIPERDASRYRGRYERTADVHRLFEILRDSIEVALSSRDEETARARYDLALECYHQLLTLDLPPEIEERLRGFVETLVERFPTAWRVNAAAHACERAGEARRAATRRGHLEEAREVLASGRDAEGVDAAEIDARLAEVHAHLALLEGVADDEESAPATLAIDPLTDDPSRGIVDLPDVLTPDPEEDAATPGAEGDAGETAAEPLAEVEIDALSRVHLALLRGRGHAVRSIAVRSRSSLPLEGARLELSSDPAFVEDVTVDLGTLPPGAALSLDERRLGSYLRYDHALLARLNERAEGTLRARLVDGAGRELAATSAAWTLETADSWPGLDTLPEVFPALVLPNEPFVGQVLSGAAERLARAGVSSELSGYQTQDPVHALHVVRAIYESLQDARITYAPPPASFDGGGQRVRFPSAIASTKVATCLDMALLAAAALEQAGLHALLVFVEGHALVGAWLVERTFANPVVHEPLRVVKRAELAELVVFDATSATVRPSPDFQGARESAERHLEDRDAFQCAVDVARARRGGVLPLPTLRTETDGVEAPGVGQEGRAPLRPDRDLEADLQAYLRAEALRREVDETPQSRLDRWLRRLLDLTMRNRLLASATKSKRVVPLLGADLAALEDGLADGRSFRVLERPSEIEGASLPLDDEARARIAPLLAAGVASGEVRSPLDRDELQVRLTNLYREARTAREEGGANSLFLAVGFLHYRETTQSTKTRRAPLLLVPLDMKRLSGRRDYSLVRGGDETRINVTLLEYLRRDHEIDVPGLEPLPLDEKGVDVELVLRVFKDAIKDEDTWEVVDEAQIGLYSFSKYLLWRDLRDRSEILRENPLVAHLIDRPGEPYEGEVEQPDPDELDDEVAASEVFAPLSYDSSQLSAILGAARGRTMVLEGPPGTGKSQTIANLVAHAMATGRTVLFVSEKMAALDVVHRRLRGLGLGPACLELHSNKANKKGVLAQFKEALDDGRVRGSRRRRWEEIGADVDARRTRLNAHVDALHRPRASGESIHEVVARIGELPRSADAAPPPGVDLPAGDPRSVDESTLRTWREVLDEVDVVAAEQLVGPEHALLLVGRTEYSPIVESETREALRAHDAPASELLAAARDVLGGIGFADGAGGEPSGIRAPASDDAWDRLAELCASLVEPPELGSAAAAAFAGGAVLDEAANSIARAEELGALRASFEATFRASPTTLDLAALEAARRDMAAGGLLGVFKRWGGKRRLVDAFRGIALEPGGIGGDVAARSLDDAQRATQLDAEIQAVADDVRALLGELWRGADTDATAATAVVDRARAIAKRVGAYAASTGSEASALAGAIAATVERARPDLAAADAALARRFRALDDARRRYAVAHEAVVDAARPLEGAPLGASLDDVEALQALCLRWVDRWTDLRGWARWQTLRARAQESGLDAVVASIEAGDLSPGETRSGFDATFAREWALHEISADPALKAFDGPDHARAVARFVELDDERLHAAREETRQRLGAKRPQPATLRERNKGTALGTLQREITKKTRHMAIRRLLAELGELAMDLKPCFLMSPMSVAQYLEPDHERFDLVVFDEASQIPVWDAIGAIARGRQAVIVGDPKQLPPTSFFDRGEDESIEEDEVEDLESILEECIGAQVPVQRLSWHYRSRHESLIAFSNARYYDGQLLTFPSNASDRLGVSARIVEGGVYDKGKTRTNPVEARAVVGEVVRRLRDRGERERSIGVVTFSQAQQTLLLDLLDEAMREHPEIEEAFDESREEPVFVKNLENVQGDERDVILFSIGYGPDANGKISMNFGPLNRDGGERRLNVAITRAREEVVVFSSIRWDQIDLARTSARAVGDLRAFLRHAEGRADVVAEDAESGAEHGTEPERPSDDGLVRALASRLEARGWDVTTEVGASSVRVDLAVRHPERPGRFLMGIETDGRNYARSATARDRDRLRALVLDGLGWSLERAWAIDWWRDPDAEVERLDAALRAALEADRPA
ncbi:MAG: DUF4011 domain-containing protein [Planctomycetota bacterium]